MQSFSLDPETIAYLRLGALANGRVDGLQALAKSNAIDLDALKLESLGPDAFYATWQINAPEFCAFSKMVPATPAKQLFHQEALITSFGNNPKNNFGVVTETSAPGVMNPTRSRQTGYLKIFGELSQTGAIAAMTAILGDTLGNESLLEQDDSAAMHRLLWNSNWMALHGDSSALSYTEEAGIINNGVFKTLATETAGLLEGGSHVINLEQTGLVPELIRQYGTKVMTLNGGMPTAIFLSPETRQNMESTINDLVRKNFGDISPIMFGNAIAGVTVNGRGIYFITDTQLAWQNSFPLYDGVVQDGAPSAPTIGTPTDAAAGGLTSYWKAANAGYNLWVVRAIDSQGRWGTGAVSSSVSVTAGHKVTIAITPVGSNIAGFAVYRAHENDVGGAASANAALIGFVAANGGSAVTFTDLNARVPRTDRAIAIPLGGPVGSAYLATGGANGNMMAFSAEMRNKGASFNESSMLADATLSRGAAVKRAMLGSTFRIDQAITGLTRRRQIVAKVERMFMPGARHCFAFDNISNS